MNGRRTIDWEQIDPELRKIYANPQRGHLLAMSKRVGIPATTLSQHARRDLFVHGINRPNRFFTKFKAGETELLTKHYPAPIWQLRAILASNGYIRTATAIVTRLMEMRKCGVIPAIVDAIEDAEHITTVELSEVMGVTQRKVQYWIGRKLLPVLPDKGPDDSRVHRYRIQRKDLHEFLVMYPGHWDSKTCDHFWLIDILTAPVLTASAKINRQDKVGLAILLSNTR